MVLQKVLEFDIFFNKVIFSLQRKTWMRGINYRSLMANWEAILDKLCDEITPHDVLMVIVKHLQHTAEMSEKLAYKNDHIKKCIEKIEEAMALIDPER